MPRWLAVSHTLHLLALALWLGGVVMAGIAAAVIFTSLKPLGLAVEGYTVPKEQVWSLLGGFPAARVFAITDMLGLGAAMVAAVTLIGAYASGVGKPWGWSKGHMAVRVISLSAVLAVFCYQLMVLAPRMAQALGQYRAAAAAAHDDEEEEDDEAAVAAAVAAEEVDDDDDNDDEDDDDDDDEPAPPARRSKKSKK